MRHHDSNTPDSSSSRIGEHIRSNVVGYVAIFLFAIGGTADSSSVTTGKVVDRSLTGADLGAGSVAGAQIADAGVHGVDVADGSITSSDIANGSRAS